MNNEAKRYIFIAVVLLVYFGYLLANEVIDPICKKEGRDYYCDFVGLTYGQITINENDKTTVLKDAE